MGGWFVGGRIYLFLESVGAVGDADGENAGEDPWWGAHEEGGDVAEAEGFGESRLRYALILEMSED